MQKKNLYNKYKKKSKKSISILKITNNIGFFYLRTLENIFLTKSNFESIRRLLSRKVKKKVNFIFFKNSNKLPTFKKPLKVRMGSGKGSVEYWVCQIRPGKVLYEMDGVSEELARHAFALASAKLPFKTTFVTRTVL